MMTDRTMTTKDDLPYPGSERAPRAGRRGTLVVTLLGLALGLAPGLRSLARADDLSADEIAKRMIRGDAFTWESVEATVRMVLTSKTGKRKERAMVIVGRSKDGLMQTRLRFKSPSDVAGTALLMLERKNEPAEQYIYLSGLRRTRRIVGRERDGSFMGSDFTYADMQPPAKHHATNKRLGDDKVGSTPTYVIETIMSKDAPNKYSKTVTWVRKTDFVAMRTRFYDRKGKLHKTLYTRRVKVIDGTTVVVEARMENAKTGHVTELFVDKVVKKDKMSDLMFTPNSLEHD